MKPSKTPVEQCDGCGGRAGHRPDGTLPFRTADNRPLCKSCYHVRNARSLDKGYADIHEPGALPSLMRGVGPDGKVPDDGADPWQFRPYRLVARDGNCECSLSGQSHICRPPPPTHVKRGGGLTVKGKGLPPPATPEELALSMLTDGEQVAYLAHQRYGQGDDGEPAATIAARIGVEAGAYRTALSRARAKMRKALGGELTVKTVIEDVRIGPGVDLWKLKFGPLE